MKEIHQIGLPGDAAFSVGMHSPMPQNPTTVTTRRPWGRLGPPIKRLLVVSLLAMALNAFADDPTATDMGRFIKFVGKQSVAWEVEDDDVTFVDKSAIISIAATKQTVTIAYAAGNLAFAFESKEAAKAFQAQIVEFCSKDKPDKEGEL